MANAWLRGFPGANVVAIGDGSPTNWEVFQFARAEQLSARLWVLHDRLRGQFGTFAQALGGQFGTIGGNQDACVHGVFSGWMDDYHDTPPGKAMR